jgi:PhnB protein
MGAASTFTSETTGCRFVPTFRYFAVTIFTVLEAVMATKAQAIPKGYHTVTPSLVVDGAAKALDFYKTALEAEELMRFPGPDGTIMHAEIRIGDSRIMLGDEMPEQGGRGPKSIGGTPVSFFVYRENVDAAWKRAVEAGGKPIMPLADQFWGDRAGCFEDPFGHHWWLAQHVEDLTPEELKKRAESFFSQTQSA